MAEQPDALIRTTIIVVFFTLNKMVH